MLEPIGQETQKRIASNVAKAVKDIDKLSKTAYKYLYLCSGFIAHYDYWGFVRHYKYDGNLRADLIANMNQNQWRNFRPGERDYEYYKSKADTYNAIMAQLV
jgi:hypothetical protein